MLCPILIGASGRRNPAHQTTTSGPQQARVILISLPNQSAIDAQTIRRIACLGHQIRAPEPEEENTGGIGPRTRPVTWQEG
jgi:hypothetical protein